MPLRRHGRTLFSAMGFVTHPREFCFRRTVYEGRDGEGCLVVIEREGVVSARSFPRDECERMLDAYRSISPPDDGGEMCFPSEEGSSSRSLQARGAWLALGWAVAGGTVGGVIQHPVEQITQHLLPLVTQVMPALNLL